MLHGAPNPVRTQLIPTDVQNEASRLFYTSDMLAVYRLTTCCGSVQFSLCAVNKP